MFKGRFLEFGLWKYEVKGISEYGDYGVRLFIVMDLRCFLWVKDGVEVVFIFID